MTGDWRRMVAAGAIVVSGCTSAPGPAPIAGGSPGVPPSLDAEMIRVGEALYLQECAECHGSDLRGAPNWKTPNADGSYPPPPHDGSGHTWHHSDATLVELIQNGSGFEQSRMPQFAGRLSEEQVLAVLEYLKSHWGDQERAFQWQITQQEAQSG